MENNRAMLPCKVIIDLLPSYIDGLASEETRKVVDEHLQACPECKAAYEAMIQPDLETAIAESSASDGDKVRYMKKIKKKHRNTILAVVAGLLALFITANYFISIRIYPFPVDRMQVAERYRLEDGSIYVKVRLDSDLVAVGGVSYSNGLHTQEDGEAEPGVQEFMLGYRLIDRITQQNRPESGYLHFLFTPDGEDAVYLRGWNGSQRLLLWQTGDEIPPVTDKVAVQIEEVLPRLGAGYTSSY